MKGCIREGFLEEAESELQDELDSREEGMGRALQLQGKGSISAVHAVGV